MAAGWQWPDHVRMMSRSSLFASLFLIPAACATDPSTQPQGATEQFVADRIYVPLTPRDAWFMGVDVNGDGKVDNEVGLAMAGMTNSLSSSGSPGVDFQGAIDSALAEGRLALQVDIQGLAAPSDAVAVQLADNPPLVGPLKDGEFATEPGSITVPINLGTSQPALLPLLGARIASKNAIAIGTSFGDVEIGGALTPDDVNTILLPAVLPAITKVVQRDCCGLPTSPGGATCVPSSCGCIANSAGAQLVDSFDSTPRDCVVTASEIAANSLAQSLLAPDVTIDGQRAVSFGMLATLVLVSP